MTAGSEAAATLGAPPEVEPVPDCGAAGARLAAMAVICAITVAGLAAGCAEGAVVASGTETYGSGWAAATAGFLEAGGAGSAGLENNWLATIAAAHAAARAEKTTAVLFMKRIFRQFFMKKQDISEALARARCPEKDGEGMGARFGTTSAAARAVSPVEPSMSAWLSPPKKKAPGSFLPVPSENCYCLKLAPTKIAAATAASAAAAAAATVIARIAARSVETSPTSSSAAGRTIFARACLVDRERAPVEIFSVKRLDCGLSFGVRTHRDKCEPARAACEFILHQHDFRNGTALREHVLNGNLGRVERKVADV